MKVKKKTTKRIAKFWSPHLVMELGGFMSVFTLGSFLFFSDDEEEITPQDTDSDVAEQREGGKVKVKWTQEEVIATIHYRIVFFFLT